MIVDFHTSAERTAFLSFIKATYPDLIAHTYVSATNTSVVINAVSESVLEVLRAQPGIAAVYDDSPLEPFEVLVGD